MVTFSEQLFSLIDGLELAEIVEQTHPKIKILLTTGFSGRICINGDEHKWENVIIRKPYRSFEIANRIRQILDT